MHRINYIIVRLLQMIPIALGITIILFFLLRAIPGDPAVIILGIKATPQAITNLHRQMGLDKPIWTQYLIFLKNMATLNLGDSLVYAVPVSSLIGQRLPVTLFLAAYATLISIGITVPLALIAAIHKDHLPDHLIRGSFMLALGMPQFWMGIVMMLVFSLWLPIFPVSGFGNSFSDHLLHLTLPAFTLAMAQSSWLIRSLRSD